ncbi:hypothetical protein FSP39_000757 [Pinctada imbricata]|uniref:Antistasin-like domain-containing protein n=1 Tax=Pinctada imbricata TaxID=66713 RepID=A0AA88Y4X4_PINIB|nr:hypothetical protein FSP39_000757 [Pinctada imbricata]
MFGGGGMCAPIHTFCPLQCPNGYMKNDHGCEMCHCADSTTPNPSQTHNPAPLSYHHIANPCIPTHARCTLRCEQFTKGAGGCEFCQCDTTHRSSSTTTPTSTTTTTTTPAPVSMTSSPASSTIDTCAIAAQICDQRCNGEYLSDHKDCTFCVCKSDLG